MTVIRESWSDRKLEILTQMKIRSVGMVRIDRFRKPPFIANEELKRKLGGRGTALDITNEDGKIAMVKWIDDTSVYFVSNFCGPTDLVTIERYEETKKKVDVSGCTHRRMQPKIKRRRMNYK